MSPKQLWLSFEDRVACGKSLMEYKEPTAKIVRVRKEGQRIITVLEAESLPSPPIAPAALYEREDPDQEVLQLHKLIEQSDNILTFETSNVSEISLFPGQVFIFRQWWTPDQLNLVTDRTRNWEKTTFHPSDAIKIPTEDGYALRQKTEEEDLSEGAEIIKGGWEHEHCALCWAPISQDENDGPSVYTDGSEWLCESCYQNHIIKRILGY